MGGNEAYSSSRVSSPQQGGTEDSVGLTAFELFVFDVVEGRHDQLDYYNSTAFLAETSGHFGNINTVALLFSR